MTRIWTPDGVSRRRALALAGGLALTAGSTGRGALAQSQQTGNRSAARGTPSLPVDEINRILQVGGKARNGIYEAMIGRKDLSVTGPHNLTFSPAWQVHHEITMQALEDGSAITNAELALVAAELQPAIDGILTNRLVFQAEHQHFVGLAPQIWHIHLRGRGDALELAHKLAAVVATTGAPLPQHSPAHPGTPLHADRLGDILGGEAEVREDGVVSVTIPRKETIMLGGTRISPRLGVNTHVDFQPVGTAAQGVARHGPDATATTDTTGSTPADQTQAAVAPDIAMIASEVDDVMKVTRSGGFAVHCLYNQESAERPQLYFSHQLAVGDAESLAHVVRSALEQTNSAFKQQG